MNDTRIFANWISPKQYDKTLTHLYPWIQFLWIHVSSKSKSNASNNILIQLILRIVQIIILKNIVNFAWDFFFIEQEKLFTHTKWNHKNFTSYIDEHFEGKKKLHFTIKKNFVWLCKALQYLTVFVFQMHNNSQIRHSQRVDE